MIYVFGEWELDLRIYELRHGQKLIKLEPQVFDVLVYLLQHRDRVVSKQELLSHLWPDQFIGESALERCIMTARKAFGDSGYWQRIIKTFYRRGYRFVAPVTIGLTQGVDLPQAQLPSLRGSDYQGQPEAVSPSLLHTSLSRGTGTRQNAGEADVETTAEHTLDVKQATVFSCTFARLQEIAKDNRRPEAVPSLLEYLFDCATQQVQAYGGLIVQFMEDGFLALFGVTLPYEEHALRAVQAALELQDGLSTVQRELGLQPKPPAVRIGLHTGDILGKRFGDDPQGIYMTVGDTLKFAANLQACVDSDRILMSETTYQLVQEAVYAEVIGLVAAETKPPSMAPCKIYQMLLLRAADAPRTTSVGMSAEPI